MGALQSGGCRGHTSVAQMEQGPKVTQFEWECLWKSLAWPSADTHPRPLTPLAAWTQVAPQECRGAGGSGNLPHKLVHSVCCLSCEFTAAGNICFVSHFSTTCFPSLSLSALLLSFFSSLSHSLRHLYLVISAHPLAVPTLQCPGPCGVCESSVTGWAWGLHSGAFAIPWLTTVSIRLHICALGSSPPLRGPWWGE